MRQKTETWKEEGYLRKGHKIIIFSKSFFANLNFQVRDKTAYLWRIYGQSSLYNSFYRTFCADLFFLGERGKNSISWLTYRHNGWYMQLFFCKINILYLQDFSEHDARVWCKIGLIRKNNWIRRLFGCTHMPSTNRNARFTPYVCIVKWATI